MKKNWYQMGGNILKYSILSILCIPHVFFFLVSKNKRVIKADVHRWVKLTVNDYHGTIFDLLYLLVFWKEYRNVYYLRIGIWKVLLQWYIRTLSSLYIYTPSENFGEGTFIQHGFATIITAERIGKKCFINQQVTIGYNGSKKYGYGKPIIEDNVRISCGAKVVGKLTVGAGSTIGVNAVVVKDVPSNSVVVPSSMQIRKEGDNSFNQF